MECFFGDTNTERNNGVVFETRERASLPVGRDRWAAIGGLRSVGHDDR